MTLWDFLNANLENPLVAQGFGSVCFTVVAVAFFIALGMRGR